MFDSYRPRRRESTEPPSSEGRATRPIVGQAGRSSCALLVLVTFAGLADSSAAGPVRPAALMRPMMEDLRSLVSLSLAPADIPQRRRDVTSALDRLMGQGGRIRAHFEAKQPTVGYFARALSWVAASQRLAERDGDIRVAVFQIAEVCSACHARSPGGDSRGGLDQLLDGVDRARLSPSTQARLASAVRDFQSAARFWLTDVEEGLELRSLVRRGRHEVADGTDFALRRYVELKLRHLSHSQEVAATLRRVSKHVGFPDELRARVLAWARVLSMLDTTAHEADVSVRRAADMVRRAAHIEEAVPGGGYIHELLAARTLDSLLAPPFPTIAGSARSEVFYRRAKLENRLRPHDRLMSAEVFFEAAVRASPKSKWAALAYKELDRALQGQFAAGVGPPPAVTAHLRKLRALIWP